MAMKKMSMKAMKAMSSMKKMAMKKSIKGSKRQVFNGSKASTNSGLKKSDLKRNKNGKVVSAKKSALGKKAFARISKWTKAVQQARKELKIKGFCAVGGKSSMGKQLLARARSLHKK